MSDERNPLSSLPKKTFTVEPNGRYYTLTAWGTQAVQSERIGFLPFRFICKRSELEDLQKQIAKVLK